MKKFTLLALIGAAGICLGAEAPAIFNKCKICHGANAEKVAPGQKTGPIAGLPKDKLLTELKGYRAGTADNGGNKAIMYAQLKNVSDADIEALASYISSLPKK